MTFANASPETRIERFQSRAQGARRLSRYVRIMLIAATFAAIWQDRNLAPPVHDRMVVVADKVAMLIEDSEGMSSKISAMTRFSGGGNKGEFDPITSALLKLRN